MAIYRFEAKIISRSGGRSTVSSASYRTGKCATSAAAYRAGAALIDERTGQHYDYTNKRGVAGAEILLPEHAPAWMRDRSRLWNAVEKIETRKDAQLARDFILTLPHELSPAQRVALTKDFVQTQFVAKGYAADIAWHAPHKEDGLNHHAHVMVPLRKVEAQGFARLKDRAPPGQHPSIAWKAELLQLRQAWENTANRHLAAAGLDLRIDCRSLAERGIDRAPEPKRGPLGEVAPLPPRRSSSGPRGEPLPAVPTMPVAASRAARQPEPPRIAGEVIGPLSRPDRQPGHGIVAARSSPGQPPGVEAAPFRQAETPEPSQAPLRVTPPPFVPEIEQIEQRAPESARARDRRPAQAAHHAPAPWSPRRAEPPPPSSPTPSGHTMRQQWKAAAKAQTARVVGKPPPRRKARSGKGESGRSFAGNLVENYLKLCRDPSKDLKRWIAEDKKRSGAAHRARPATQKEAHGYHQGSPLAGRQGLRGQPLHAVQDGLDADRQGWRGADRVLAGSRAGAGRYDELRQVRAEGSGGGRSCSLSAVREAAAVPSSCGAEIDAVLSFYRAKLDAVRRGLSLGTIAAAVRAILNEQIVAVREIVGRAKVVRPEGAGAQVSLKHTARRQL